MKNLFGSLLLALMTVSCSVSPMQGPRPLETVLSDETFSTVRETTPSTCRKNLVNVNGTTPKSEVVMMAKEGCQLHLYPCGTCSVGGGPGAILVREDCSQSCEKCGN